MILCMHMFFLMRNRPCSDSEIDVSILQWNLIFGCNGDRYEFYGCRCFSTYYISWLLLYVWYIQFLNQTMIHSEQPILISHVIVCWLSKHFAFMAHISYPSKKCHYNSLLLQFSFISANLCLMVLEAKSASLSFLRPMSENVPSSSFWVLIM